MKRILFVLEYYLPKVGGVEVAFQHLAEELVRRGYEVRIVTARLAGTSRYEVIGGVEVFRVPTFRPFTRLTFTMFSVPVAMRHARWADVVHTTTYSAAPVGWLAARVLRKPAVLTVHEVFDQQWLEMPGMSKWAGSIHRAVEWLVLSFRFDRYVTDSNFTRQRLLSRFRKSPADVRTIYCSIDRNFWNAGAHASRDLRQEFKLPDDGFAFLYFGRPGVSKGVEYLVEAMAEVVKEVPAARLILILSRDPAEQHRRMVKRIAESELQGTVILLDSVPKTELPSYILGSDCVVVPSISEGFGYSALEAACLGKAVISTSGHAVEEILGDVVSLAPRQSSEGLAAAMVTAVRSPRTANVVRDFSPSTHADRMLALYAEAGGVDA